MNKNQSTIWPNLSGGPVIPGKQGIDYLIVRPDQKTLDVFFFNPVSQASQYKSIFRIEGGEEKTSISINSAISENMGDGGYIDNVIHISLDDYGDWAPYRLIISESAWSALDIDPVFSSVIFSFKVDCPNDIDCKQHLPGFEKFPALRDFDYQSKDFESFKQVMFDRLPSTIPDWWDRAEADFGIALIDILAYTADRMSYYQDRVAADSHLATARSRESVAKHLKLIDYRLDPGETATVYEHFKVDHDITIPAGIEVETAALSYETPVTFTLRKPFYAYMELNQLKLYDFSHPSLLIPKGALQITVMGKPKGLDKGSLLVLENGEDGTKLKRHLVELSTKPRSTKTATEEDITILAWEDSFALPWDLLLSKGRILGNIVKLHHGRSDKNTFYVRDVLKDYDLEEGPLGYIDGHPMICLKIDGVLWRQVASLKESMPYDMHYQILDLDNGKNRILFGDNENGIRPGKYSMVEIEYHTGLGMSGNVAAGMLVRLAGSEEDKLKGIEKNFNPFAAEGGREPETEEHAKLWGPKKVREQKRAVTLDDYAKEAMDVPGVSRAVARFVWTGSWVTVRVTIDPQGTVEVNDELKIAIFEHLNSRKMAGYDIQIFPARYVPLKIRISFCLMKTAFRDQVLRDLKSALGNSIGIDGIKGFFHPDNWTFAQNVELSELYAAIARVQGIECAEVLEFKRLRREQSNEIATGIISMKWDEIAMLDNNRSFPEHGKLDLELVGGR